MCAEALHHAGVAVNRDVEVRWINSELLEKTRSTELLQGLDGIVVPGGFGYRGIEGKLVAARHARERTRYPIWDCGLGMQVMVVELTRYVVRNDEPNSTEFDVSTPYPVIDLMADQRELADMGGTMRLGAYPCHLNPHTLAGQAYGDVSVVQERHRHRFELNNAYRKMLAEAGMVFAGVSPGDKLVEIA